MIDWKGFEELIQWKELNKSVKSEEPTFFDIAGFPHYETVISNFYNYYFDLSQPHGFENLFIISLLNIIYQKSNIEFSFNIKVFNSFREIKTNNGNFIDIVLVEGDIGEDFKLEEEYSSAIIIENKINANLYNDLNDYYKSIKSKNKIGVVLALKPLETKHQNFVCITHNELLNEITKQALSYLLNASERQIAIFKDFVRNLQSFYTNAQMKLEIDKHIEFFYNNGSKMKRLFEEYNTFLVHLNETIEQVALRLDFESMNKRSSAKKTSVFGLPNSPLSWWVYLEKIVYERSFIIELWIQQNNEAVNKWKSLSEKDLIIYNELTQKAGISVNTAGNTSDKNTWRKIGTKSYNISFEDLNNFNEYFENIIKTDWIPLKDEVVRLQLS